MNVVGRRAVAVLVAAALLGVGGCGGDPASSPEQPSAGDVALLYVDAFRGSPEGLLEYNPDSSWDDSYFETVGSAAAESWDVTFTDDQEWLIATSFRQALAQVEASVTAVAGDQDRSVVTLDVTGIDVAASLAEHAEDLDLTGMGQPARTKALAGLLIESLEDVLVVAEPTPVELTFTKNGSTWTPEDSGARNLVSALVEW